MSLNKHLKGESLVDSSEDPNVKAIATRIQSTVAENDARCAKDVRAQTVLEIFNGPKMKLNSSEYVQRIAKYGRCSPSCFTMAMVYLGRIRRNNDGLCLHSENIQRLLPSLVMVGSKVVDDQFYSNSVWAQVAGISTLEINALEVFLLKQLDFGLFIAHQEYRLFSEEFFGIDATKMDPVAEDDDVEDDVDSTPESKPIVRMRPLLPCCGRKSKPRAFSTLLDPVSEQPLQEISAMRKLQFDREMEPSVSFDSGEESSAKLALRQSQSSEERTRVFSLEFRRSQSLEEHPQEFSITARRIEFRQTQSEELSSQVDRLDSDDLPSSPTLSSSLPVRHVSDSGSTLLINSDHLPPSDLCSSHSPASSESSIFHFDSDSDSSSRLDADAESNFGLTFPEMTRSFSLDMDGLSLSDGWNQPENATHSQLEKALKIIASKSDDTPVIKGCWDSGAEFEMIGGRTRTFTISEIL